MIKIELIELHVFKSKCIIQRVKTYRIHFSHML